MTRPPAPRRAPDGRARTSASASRPASRPGADRGDRTPTPDPPASRAPRVPRGAPSPRASGADQPPRAPRASGADKPPRAPRASGADQPPRPSRAPGTARTPGATRPARASRVARPERPERAPVLPGDAPEVVARSTVIGGAPRWVSGALAGVQAALLSVLAVVTPALAAYVATSADPANADVGWTRSVAVGAALWLMGHGGALQVGGLSLTIVPLGVTVLALFAAHASARRSAYPTPGAWAAGIGGYLVAVLLVTLLAGDAGPLGAGWGSVARTLIGATLIAAIGLGWGLLRPGRLAVVTRPLWSRVPPVARAAARAGALVPAALLAVAAAVTVGWALSGRAATGDVIVGLGLDTFSGLVMAVAQLSLVPNLVLWALAWLAGPGFAVGQGTVFSPTEVVSGPMPALPLLGALPAEPSGAGPWVPLLVVAAGAIAGWWLHRRLEPRSPWQPLGAAVGSGLVAGLVVGVATALAAGSAGPGRMSEVGAQPLLVGGTVALLAGLGAVVVAVPTDAAVRAALRGAWSRLRGRAGRSAARADGAAPHAAPDPAPHPAPHTAPDGSAEAAPDGSADD
ncbi:cell division protein PerM [Actinotalea fermentans]|uniref:Uncharacterized protein n=1 Tax=Actinotalea fermentans TaxID=43671 RepID=A0A511Z041_9CELL|nr:DUF6350 family protein [Actinotalea fermentans]GEN80746.1 hypothetical protein AFE02nite_24800 [Actinotalea fermentans]